MGFLGEVMAWFADGAHWQGDNGVPNRLWEHVAMSVLAMAVALVVALPVGLVLGHTGRGGAFAINISNLGRAVPSFAILVLAAQVFGIGATPALVALVCLAVPPVVTNTYTAIRGVDDDVREAASGMGLTGLQTLTRVEVPMALPLMMAGIRTSAVQVVATATLAALVGWGGLGRYIIDGIATRQFDEVFAGAMLVAGLSLMTEIGLARLQRLLVPEALSARASPSGERDMATLPGAATVVSA